MLPSRLSKIELERREIWKDYLSYSNERIKHIKCLSRINFLQKCWNAKIIPRFLKFRIPENGCFIQSEITKFQRNLLRKEMNQAKSTCKLKEKDVEIKRNNLKERLPRQLIPTVIWQTNLKCRRHGKIIGDRQKNKLNALAGEQNRTLFNQKYTTAKLLDLKEEPPD